VKLLFWEVHEVKDEDKTKEQLINELVELRQRITDLQTCLDSRTRAEEVPQENNILHAVIEVTPDPIFVKDLQGIYLMLNSACACNLGRSVEEVIGKDDATLFSPDVARYFTEFDRRIMTSGEAKTFEEVVTTLGKYRTYLTTKAPYRDHLGNIVGLIGIAHDITKYKQAVDEINRLAKFPSENPNPVLRIAQDGTILYANMAASPLLNVWRCQEGQPLPDKWHKFALEVFSSGVRKDTEVECEDRTFALTFAPVVDAGYASVYGLDTTERKRAEEKLRRLSEELELKVEERTKELRKERDYTRHLIESSPDFQMTLDKDGRIMDVNEAFEQQVGKGREELIGSSIYEYLPKKETEKAIAEIFEKGKVRNIELTADIPGKGTLISNFSGMVFTTPEGDLEIYTTGRDITDRKQAAEQIKAALREKEILLREIHHRVKNNLQVISSMLYLQSGYIEDKEVLRVFKKSQNRIKSMALVHEELYQSKDLEKIDLAGYIRKLVTGLIHSYEVNPDDIKQKINVHNVLLCVNTAIPCGLIINELVSNSLKHAFPDGKEGEILIELRSDNDNKFTLIVSDNGVGFPKDLDFRNSETMGLQLVITLVKQLKGTIKLDRSAGTTFKISFAELNYKKRV
jgi:PAS domain S-box-containing protein